MIGRAWRRRRLVARLRALDKLDARYSLGAYPVGTHRLLGRVGRAIVLVAGMALVVVLVAAAGWVPTSVRAALGLGPKRLKPSVQIPTHGAYAFLQTEPGSQEPVTWDPCRPIRYRINASGAPPHAVSLIQEAVATASKATGLKFEYAGTTDDRPAWDSPYVPRFVGHDRPVLVSWATAAEVPELSGRVAGIGGAIAATSRFGKLRYVTGGVTLDSDAFGDMAQRPAGYAQERAIVLHELGHLVGLAHVHDRGELMDAENAGLLAYGPGDLQGLALLGSTPCL